MNDIDQSYLETEWDYYRVDIKNPDEYQLYYHGRSLISAHSKVLNCDEFIDLMLRAPDVDIFDRMYSTVKDHSPYILRSTLSGLLEVDSQYQHTDFTPQQLYYIFVGFEGKKLLGTDYVSPHYNSDQMIELIKGLDYFIENGEKSITTWYDRLVLSSSVMQRLRRFYTSSTIDISSKEEIHNHLLPDFHTEYRIKTLIDAATKKYPLAHLANIDFSEEQINYLFYGYDVCINVNVYADPSIHVDVMREIIRQLIEKKASNIIKTNVLSVGPLSPLLAPLV